MARAFARVFASPAAPTGSPEAAAYAERAAEADAEILQRARSEAAELRAQAEAYKRAKIIEARGEATRFEALVTEYQLAPEVTRRRLYLETMEEILPGIGRMGGPPVVVKLLEGTQGIGVILADTTKVAEAVIETLSGPARMNVLADLVQRPECHLSLAENETA